MKKRGAVAPLFLSKEAIMELSKIVQFINDKLAGELLTFDLLKVHLDAVVDDINTSLNAKFPAFSDFTSAAFTQYPDYNFFPDKYIRTVVIPGAAYKFFVTDEEGLGTAPQYGFDYKDNLFKMLRDYLPLVPAEYRDTNEGGYASNFPNRYPTPYGQDW